MTKQNKISIICLLFTASLLFVACANDRRSPFLSANHIDFDTITVVERHHLSGDTLNPYCEIRINFIFPVSSEEISVDTLQRFFVESVFGLTFREFEPFDAVRKYVQAYIANYIADARTFRESVRDFLAMRERTADMNVYDEGLPISDVFFSYYEDLSNVITYNQHGILAFQVKQSNRKGDFISFDSFRNHVIDLHTGTRIIEFDIFNPGYDRALQSLIIASLLEQNGVRSIDELEDIGFFGIEEIVPNGNFLLDDKGITYTFNKGEYSVYQIDAPTVFIPYSSIRSLLRGNTVVARLADL
jgi:hypothetical protein